MLVDPRAPGPARLRPMAGRRASLRGGLADGRRLLVGMGGGGDPESPMPLNEGIEIHYNKGSLI